MSLTQSQLAIEEPDPTDQTSTFDITPEMVTHMFEKYTSPEFFALGCTESSISSFCFKLIVMELFGFKPSKSSLSQEFPNQTTFTLSDVQHWVKSTTSLANFERSLLERMIDACTDTHAITMPEFRQIILDGRGEVADVAALFRRLDRDGDGVLGRDDLRQITSLLYISGN
ncbi:Protein of unknown function DUF2373 [Carpediemonas membranifera]|uniref:EF-hand domain-containing protein n=1 Tax=Carpediemonas membranifera TaxID=201153 RepID=A0A8J6AYZ7_9EUKA|nr:Protein of unknown function DUF2373 [Carpediemonas membranifera]|eukprot:KAG9394875.1 Protein of unknown function DUF2373 [Carpediemonas membranifera]